jgi:hypothetical protein
MRYDFRELGKFQSEYLNPQTSTLLRGWKRSLNTWRSEFIQTTPCQGRYCPDPINPEQSWLHSGSVSNEIGRINVKWNYFSQDLTR